MIKKITPAFESSYPSINISKTLVLPHPAFRSNQQLIRISQLAVLNQNLLVEPMIKLSIEQKAKQEEIFKFMNEFILKAKKKAEKIKELSTAITKRIQISKQQIKPKRMQEEIEKTKQKIQKKVVNSYPQNQNDNQHEKLGKKIIFEEKKKKNQKNQNKKIEEIEYPKEAEFKESLPLNSSILSPQITYICQCPKQKIITNKADQFKSHIKIIHKNHTLNCSSHILTPLGNLIIPDWKLIIRRRDLALREKELKGQVNRQRKGIFRENNQSITSCRRMENTPIKQLEFSQDLLDHQENKQEKTLKKNEGIFYCGQCNQQFRKYQGYVRHMFKHDFIISEKCSHIVVRQKKSSFGLEIREVETDIQKYYCSCEIESGFGRKDFINHVLKWHKGITPQIK